MSQSRLKIEGTLSSGLNRGAKFLALPMYNKIFEKELNGPPFCGTLNLSVDRSLSKDILAKIELSHEYDNLWFEGKRFGGILILPARLSWQKKQFPCVIVRPKLTTHEIDTLEIVAKISFRDHWNVSDGDVLTIEF